eukprot:2852100-Rhodomonas_salina.3
MACLPATPNNPASPLPSCASFIPLRVEHADKPKHTPALPARLFEGEEERDAGGLRERKRER